jgi:pimeloyl-ACP methyl ester carboxylesterase
VSLDNIHIYIAKTGIDVFTLWGGYDTVIVFDDFESKLNHILPDREEFFFKSAGHLPQMESPKEFNTVLFENILDFTNKK